jgi:hypothetical protein
MGQTGKDQGGDMPVSDKTAQGAQYVQRLLENSYAQENLSDAVESLRAAYRRASKRRVEPSRDEKLRRQVREAALSLTEAASALNSNRHKPKKRRGRRVLILFALVGGGTAVALALRGDLREKALGGGSVVQAGDDGAPAAPSPEGAMA